MRCSSEREDPAPSDSTDLLLLDFPKIVYLCRERVSFVLHELDVHESCGFIFEAPSHVIHHCRDPPSLLD